MEKLRPLFVSKCLFVILDVMFSQYFQERHHHRILCKAVTIKAQFMKFQNIEIMLTQIEIEIKLKVTTSTR